MKPLPTTVTDAELLAQIDQWAALLEHEDYEQAFAFTGHITEMGWTPALIQQIIKAYGDASPDQRVTVNGVPTDITQRKRVRRWSTNVHGCFGEIWYDLNIDWKASDLTATFDLRWADGGVVILLNDIHVM